ncbi:MAG: hypothetical protein ACPG4X_15960 [Pikeienuella sp.]
MTRHINTEQDAAVTSVSFPYTTPEGNDPQRVGAPHPRDPENMDPYGAQNHPLPPFVPREV